MCSRISGFCDWFNYNMIYIHDIIQYKKKLADILTMNLKIIKTQVK